MVQVSERSMRPQQGVAVLLLNDFDNRRNPELISFYHIVSILRPQ